MNPQWQTYKQSELISDTVPEPPVNHSLLVTWLNPGWRFCVNQSLWRRSSLGQIHHVERCWFLENSGKAEIQTSGWQRLWIFLNQPIEVCLGLTNEPEIQQVADQCGQVWWYIYDPLTGQSFYLESEAEVLTWLEERQL